MSEVQIQDELSIRAYAVALFEKQIVVLIKKTDHKRIRLCELPARFLEEYSTNIPYQNLGYATLKGLLGVLSSLIVLTVHGDSDGDSYVCRVDSSEHDAAEQTQGYAPTISKHIGAPLMQVKAFTDKEQTANKPEGNDDRCAVARLEKQIGVLIDKSGDKRISLGILPACFLEEYATTIPYKELGYAKLKSLLSELSSLTIHDSSDGNVYVCRADSSAHDIAEQTPRTDPPSSKHIGASPTQVEALIGNVQNANKPEDTDALAQFEKQICELIDKTDDKRISLCELQASFIPSKDLGYTNLKSLLSELSSLNVHDSSDGGYLCRAHSSTHGMAEQTPGNAPTSSRHISASPTQVKEFADNAQIANKPEGNEDTYALARFEKQICLLIDKTDDNRISLCELQACFFKEYSKNIPLTDFGYAKLTGLLSELSSLIVHDSSDGNGYVCRADSSSAHGMAEQTPGNTPPGSDHIGASPTQVEAFLENMQIANKPEGNEDTYALARLEKQICVVIDKTDDKRIPLSKVPALFLQEYSKNIPYKDLGYTKLKSLLSVLPSLAVHDNISGHGYVCRADSLSQDMVEQTGCAPTPNFNKHISDPPNHLEALTDKVKIENKPEGNDDTESLVLKTAKGLTSTKLHRRIIEFLDQNPEGVTCSRIMKEVKGFAYLLKERAEEAGEKFISPSPVLHACEGVRSVKVEGKRLFLPENDKSNERMSKPSLQVGLSNNTADGKAVVEFLRLLQNEFGGRPWPGSKKQLKQFLLLLDPCKSPSVDLWLRKSISTDELSQGKKIKEAMKRIMFQLRNEGIVAGNNTSLEWNLTAIGDFFEKHKHNQAHVQVQSDSSDLHNDGITTVGGSMLIKLIDSIEMLDAVKVLFPFCPQKKVASEDGCVVAIDCEGVPKNIFLIQVGTSDATYVFDCIKLGAAEVCKALTPLLTDATIMKLFHDIHNDAVAFAQIGRVEPLRGTLDTQLALEALTGDLHIGFNLMLQQLGQGHHPLKNSMKGRMDDGHLFAQRPLPPDVLEYAALDVSLLIEAQSSLFDALGEMVNSVQRASDERARLAPMNGGARQICFDVANSYRITSLELLREQRPSDMLSPHPLEVSNETTVLINMLPPDLQKALAGQTENLSDIVLDKGRAPLAWVKGDRIFLGDNDRIVKQEDIESIVESLGGFGTDNRAGLEQQLHRISAMRNRQSEIVGLTMRVGRHVTGNASIVSDLLFADSSKSILFLGEPGSGKTTVVREVTRLLAELFNVCIVDTSNEIAGDGDVPHPCVGFARRMMVPTLDQQSNVMIECVQNHTPAVMVIDEIGRPTEVEAARTCKQRGVRLIASAHGDLRKLIKNPKLRGLIGGVETVTIGDAQAKVESKKGVPQKLKAQRAGSPTFDAIVELRGGGAHHEWRIIMDTEEAVDKVLDGQHYFVQRRTRDPLTGALTLALDAA